MVVLQAFALSCSIFMTLMAKFRHSLKADIGVFFPMIMLKAIEPPVVAASAAQGRETIAAQHLLIFHPAAPIRPLLCQAIKAAVAVASAVCEVCILGLKASMAHKKFCFMLHVACHEGHPVRSSQLLYCCLMQVGSRPL